ncbi:MAG: hypothetical protein M9949_04805 [Candidatus Kapabacteria bacterium]|nr:hypothetical protein [Candidatus Kapabacteria bacterium]
MKKVNKNFIQHISDNHGESSEEYLKDAAPLIGKIIIEFNSLEVILNGTICEMINKRTETNRLMQEIVKVGVK